MPHGLPEIDESEVKEIIATGEINYQKVEENAKGENLSA